MGPEAAYWAALTSAAAEPGSSLAGLIDRWLAAGNRSARELFELHPEMLAAALGRPVEELAALLTLRGRLPQAQRLLDRLGRAGVDLLPRWDRRYPRALRVLADERHEAVLWYAGALDLLEQDPVAVAGPRDVGAEGRDFARALAGAVASQGRAVLGGLAQTVERVAMEGAMVRERGGGIAVLGQGIARALPDLLRLQGELRAGRLLVISRLPLEAAWQPAYEPERGRTALGLMARLVLAQAEVGDGSWQLAHAALQAGRVVLVRATGTEACEALLAQGAMPIGWPARGDEALAAEALRPQNVRGPRGRDAARSSQAEHGESQPSGPQRMEAKGEQKRTSEPGTEVPRQVQPSAATGDGREHTPAVAARPRRKGAARGGDKAAVDLASAAAEGEPTHGIGAGAGDGSTGAHPQLPSGSAVAAKTELAPPIGAGADAAHAHGLAPVPVPEGDTVPETGPPLEAALLRYLRRHRRRVTSKGLLLQALPAEEWAIDQALAMLIAAGQVAEHGHRTGVGYAPATPDGANEGGGSFQLSLFGQPDGGGRAEPAPAGPSATASLPHPTAAEGNGISR